MLTILRDSADVASLPELPRDVIWIDLLNPTKEETTFVEVADESPNSINRDAERN